MKLYIRQTGCWSDCKSSRQFCGVQVLNFESAAASTMEDWCRGKVADGGDKW